LPLVPVREVDLIAPAAASVAASVVTATTIETPVTVPPQKPFTRTTLELLPWVLAIGIVVRAMWLGVGFLRLRRLPRRGMPALLEETVRTLFWFHPAMRWALAQVQLCREETVDTLAVAITGARRSYMNALMMFADPSAVAPAMLFARRRQLVLRMKAISQEVP